MKLKFLFLFISLISLPCFAEVYRYIDQSGNVNYVTDIEQVPEQYKNQLKNQPDLPQITRSKSQNWEEKLSSDPRYKSKYGKGIVNVYVSPNCGYCYQLEDFLKQNRVSYNRLDINANKKALKDFRQLGGKGTPLTEIDGQVIHGYSPTRIAAILDL